MNRLIILKRISFLGINSLLLTTCYALEYDPPVYNRTVAIIGTADFNTSNFIVNKPSNEAMELSFISNHGNSEVYKLKENAMSLSHVVYRDEFNNIVFESGTFRISGLKGDQISGTYHGGGQGNENGEVASLLLNVISGYGYYAGAEGTLSGQLILNPDYPDRCDFNYSGQISLPHSAQFIGN